jgi:UDP-N-acetylglucosamine--N-acetylmuramyl-(pentapeptide) pyrophosphoryl-undecaprenol N-acetylglucosamine transferase
VERKIVADWDLEYYGIPSGKLRRYFSFQNFTDIFRIMAGFFKARKILRKKRPSYLFSKGGFVSVPPVLAARSLGIPVFTHDSDVTPGLATRINSPFARKIFLPYRKSLDYTSPKYRVKCIVSGNPVRKEFFTGKAEKGREFVGAPDNVPLLLVLGGSLGAEQINTLVEKNLDALSEFCFVVHQTGSNNFSPLEHDNYYRAPYFNEELYDIMAAAGGALTRCGATSLWELTASKTPLLMMPLIAGSRGDQPYNARIFEEAGAGTILNEKELNPDIFISRIKALFNETQNKERFEKAAAFLNLGKAESIILRTIEEELKI